MTDCNNEIIVKTIADIDDNSLSVMFDLYKATYVAANQELWFNTKEDLKKYNCGTILLCNKDTPTDINAYILFQFKKKANKISLLCHNGTANSKNAIIEITYQLLTQNGWILEASDALSWVLRKKGTPIVTDYAKIIDLLDIKNSKHELITMNPDFDKNIKETYSYVHSFMDDSENIQFSNKETLFGNGIGCIYDGDVCDRKCITPLESGITPLESVSKKRTKSKKTKKQTKKRTKRRTTKKSFRSL